LSGSAVQELTLALLRYGFLALLWLFVLAAVRVIRTDLFGPRETAVRQRAQPAHRAAPQRAATPRADRKARRSAARRLVVTAGPGTGASVPLDATPVTIGRGENCSLVVEDDYVSTEHARLVPGEGRWLVMDLGSTNGTYVGQQRVTEPTAVPVGAPIRVGKTTLELRR
jgi:pSer/pThr/pTyr-binding forkhead associated (FHA) protein